MTAATLVRRSFGASQRAREYYDVDIEPVILFDGELADAIRAAQAIPVAERYDVTLETEDQIYSANDFDSLTPDGVLPRDLDMMHGSLTVRVTAAAIEQLRGGLSRLMSPMSIVGEHLDAVQAIVKRKQASGDILDLDGKRVLLIDLADLASVA